MSIKLGGSKQKGHTPYADDEYEELEVEKRDIYRKSKYHRWPNVIAQLTQNCINNSSLDP